MKVLDVMLSLLRFELLGTAIDKELKNILSPSMLKALYKNSQRHDLSHLVADALGQNGLVDDSEGQKWILENRLTAVYRYEQMNFEYENIKKLLDEEKLFYLPLKGAVLRKYYAEPWMRTSCDIDILIKEEDLDRALKLIKENLQYRETVKSSHDVSLFSPSGIHLELHYSLIDNKTTSDMAKVLERVWDVSQVETGCQKAMPDEFFYFYHISHMAKHFVCGGCGIRPFLDLWVLNNHMPKDKNKRKALLVQGNLEKFAMAVEKLSRVWLLGEEYDSISLQLESYIFTGGVYGTLKNRVTVQQQKKGGKFKYILSRIFLPYKELKYGYPILQKYKILYPFCVFLRLCKLLIKSTAKKSIREFNVSSSVSKETQKITDKLLKILGLL